MKTPFDVVQLSSKVWNIVAWREEGVIFLKEVHNLENEMNLVTYSNPNSQYNPRHLCLNLMRILLSLPSNHVMDEHEKHMKIGRVSLNNLTLLTLSEVNAIDEDGNDIKIANRRHDWKDRQEKEDYFAQRWLQLWAYAQLANQKTIIMAKKRANTLLSVEEINASTDAMIELMERELADGATFSGKNATWSGEASFDFLYRVLVLIHELLTSPRTLPGRVIQLTYKQGKTSVIYPRFLSASESEQIKVANV